MASARRGGGKRAEGRLVVRGGGREGRVPRPVGAVQGFSGRPPAPTPGPPALTPGLPGSPPTRENTGPRAASDPGASRCHFPAIRWPVATLFAGRFGAAARAPPPDFLWAGRAARGVPQVKSGGLTARSRGTGSEK